MESTLIAIAAGATLFAIVVVVISARRWNARIRSAERVETLQTLVAEAAQAERDSPSRKASAERRPAVTPQRAIAPNPAIAQSALTPMFSVTVPDAGGRQQVSFARGRQHDDVQA